MTTSEQGVPRAVVELRGGIAPDLVDYARGKVAVVLGHTGRAVLRARVRVLRHRDPARARPVEASADVDLNGRPVHVHVTATRPHEAVDLLVERLDHRLERLTRPIRKQHRQRPARRSRPRDDADIVRRHPRGARCCSVQDAAAEMDDLGYDFHLFTDIVSGQDAVVYRGGPTGLRLALADGGTAGPYGPDITVSAVAAPVLDTGQALARLEITGRPFVFYLDADHGRAALLHHRHDGGYGLLDLAD